MNKKGFTLVELIAILSLLALIALVTIPTMTNTISKSKNKALQRQKDMIIDAAKKYAVDFSSELPSFEGDKYSVSLEKLRKYSYLDDDNIIDPTTDKSMKGCVELTYHAQNKKYSYEYVTQCSYYPSSPVLDDVMIPVKYVGNKWVTVGDSKWYNYENREWANVVIVKENKLNHYKKAAEGEEVLMTDIEAFFVWIPRFSYTIQRKNASGNTTYGCGSTNISSPGSIDIKFVPRSDYDAGAGYYYGGVVSNYRTSNGFWFDDNNDGIRDKEEELSGIWVGKFESTAIPNTNCYNDRNKENCKNTDLQVLPNERILTYQNLNTRMHTAQKFGIKNKLSNKAKLLKNSEYGVIAYLTQSIYGVCTSRSSCVQPRTNANPNYITGDGNYVSNVLESSTQNITGVYDLVGGAWEATTAVYNENLASSSTFEFPEKKYFDNYKSGDISKSCNDDICYGDAFSETAGWYNNGYREFLEGNSLLSRGGSYQWTPGLFTFDWSAGGGGDLYNENIRLTISMK